MQNYTNEELCYLISCPCNNTAKAEYYKQIKFEEEELEHQLVLHIPTRKYVKDRFVEVDGDQFVKTMLEGLGATSYYVTKALGSYKGRVYPEKLVTIFLKAAAAERVDYWFKHAIVKCHLNLRQEAYAYELDGKLKVVKI